MARRRKRKVEGLSVARRIAQILIVAVIGTAALLLACRQTVRCLRGAPMFRIRRIVIDPGLPFSRSAYLEGLKGRSLFNLDLRAVARRLEAAYPQVDALRVERRFPDRIVVRAKKRRPFVVLLVPGGRDVVLDRAGVVLPKEGFEEGRLPLVKVGGVERSSLRPGRVARGRGLRTALAVVDAFRKDPEVGRHTLVTIDAARSSRIECILDDGLKVLLDDRDVRRKLGRLGILLAEGRIDPKAYEYIDLRFREPVGKK